MKIKTNADCDKLSNRKPKSPRSRSQLPLGFNSPMCAVPLRHRGTGQTVDNCRAINLGNGADERKSSLLVLKFPQRYDRA